MKQTLTTKKLVLISSVILLHLLTNTRSMQAQALNSWIQKSSLPGVARQYAVAFSIGTKGYVGTGYNASVYYSDFWEYDATNDTWTQKASYAGGIRFGAFGFSVGSKGYIGTGGDGTGVVYNDFWEYDPGTNAWTAKSSYPGQARLQTAAFSIGTKAYVGTGSNGAVSPTYLTEFYEYNPSNDTWTAKTNFPGSSRFGALSFAIGTKGYIGGGHTYAADFFEYDPTNNSWTQKANMPIPIVGGVGVNSPTKGYAVTGFVSTGYVNNTQEYDPITNTWLTTSNFGGVARSFGIGFTIGNKIYVGMGFDGGSFLTNMYEFTTCNPINITASPSKNVCVASTVTLTASGLNTYTWTGGISNGVGFTANSSVKYIVTGTSSGTCAGTFSRSVQINTITAPTNQAVSPPTASVVCSGNATLSLTGQTGVFYYLRNDANNNVIAGPIEGTGSPMVLNTANVNANTTFNVNAVASGYAFNATTNSGYATINNPYSVNADFTWEAWFKTGTDGTIFSLSPPTGAWGAGGKSMFVRYGRLSFDIYNVGYMEMPSYLTSLNDSKWHHAAITNKGNYNGLLDRTTMYVDGQVVLTKSDWDINSLPGYGLVNKIGYTNFNFPAITTFTGNIDDVKIWSTERTQAQIISDMRACLVGNEAGLDGYYNFDDGPGSNGFDDNTVSGAHPALLNGGNLSTAFTTGRELCSTCSTQMSVKPVVSILGLTPQTVSVLTPSFCNSGSTSVTIASSETGVNYYLGGSTSTMVSGPFAGSGSALNFFTGTVSTTTTFSVTSRKTSVGLNFDGVDDNISVNETAALAQFSNTPLTLEAWVYPTNISTVRSVIRKDGAYNLYLNAGKIYFELFNGSTFTSNSGQTTLPTNQWSHIAAVWAGSGTATLYLNGNAETIVSNTGSNSNTSKLTIGRSTLYNEPFSGKIDEIRIWSTARTATQIYTGKSACLTGSESGLLLLYKMDDSGITITDAAGGDNNGILLNTDPGTVWTSGADNCGCTIQHAITPTVSVFQTPTLSVNSATICSGNTVTIVPTGNTGGTFTITGNNFTVSPNSTTSYSVTGTSTAGCVSANTAVSTVSVNTSPTLAVNSATICSGNSVAIVPTGNSGGTYTITGNNYTVTPLSTTAYSITGTSAAGCVATNTAVSTISVNTTPTLSVNSATICSGNSVAIVPTGNAGGTFTITGNNFTVTPFTTTAYSVTGRSAAGCLATNTAVSTISVNTTPTLSVNNATICSGNSVAIVPGGNTGGTYTISGNNFTVTPLANTSYSVTGTSAAGCVASNTAVSTVSVNTTPTLSVNSATICSGSSVAIVPAGNIGGTYTITGTNYTVTPLATTAYSLTGTSAAGCAAQNTAVSTISVNTTPTLSVNSATICSGNSVAIVPSGNTGGTFTITGNTFTVTPLANTSYSVTGTSAAGCVASNTAVSTVSVNTTPTLSVNSATICSGSSVAIVPAGNIGGTYTITGNNYTVTPLATTAYSLTGTSAAGCAAQNTAVSTISVNTTPTLSVNSATICSGNSVAIVPTGNAGGTHTITGNNFTVTPATNASYTLTGTSAAGCPASNTVVSTVSVNATPTLGVNNATICSGTSVAIVPTGISGGTYTITGNNFTVTPSASTSYSVTGTSAAGCAASNTAVSTVSVNASPTITVNSASICSGNSVAIVASGANTYTISGNNFTVSPASTTAYSVTGTGTNGCISLLPGIANITVNVNPTITVGNVAICPGNSYTLTPSGAFTYTYSNGSNVVTPTTNTSYTITGTSAEGCASTNTAVATVSVINTVTVTVSGTQSICAGQSATFTAGGATTYSWNTGASTASITLNPSVTTNFTVMGVSGTCSNTAVVNLTVNQTPTVTVNSGSVCVGTPFVMNPSGALTYTFSNGSATVTPAVNTSYSVSGTDALGCVSASPAVSSVTVNALPTLSASSTASIICIGEAITISVTGASTYSWGGSQTGNSITISPTVNVTFTITGTDANGCENTAIITQSVDLCTSLNKTSTENVNLSVYPNPNNGEFILEAVENTTVMVLNSIGQIVLQTRTTSVRTPLSVSHLANGIYFVKVITDGNQHTVKIVKE